MQKDRANRFAKIREFVAAVNQTQDQPALRNLLESAARDFGYERFTLINLVTRFRSLDDFSGLVAVSNYPPEWIEIVRSRGLFANDPVHVACQTRSTAFRWAALPDIIRMTAAQQDHLDLCRAHGIGDGVTIPVHLPGEYSGSCTFTSPSGTMLDEDFLPVAQWIGCSAFEAARRIAQKQPNLAARSITDRQAEIILWICKGKSEGVTAEILGISPHTVHTHLKIVKSRWGIATKPQLVAKALHSGVISFGDVLQ